MEAVGRAGVASDPRGRGTHHNVDLLLFLRQLLHGERHRRGGELGDHVDTLGIIPAPGNRGGEIGLVLVVRSDDLDLLAEHLAAEILDRHPGGLQRIFAARVGIDARLIVQDTDLDLCRSGRHEKHCANSHGRQQS